MASQEFKEGGCDMKNKTKFNSNWIILIGIILFSMPIGFSLIDKVSYDSLTKTIDIKTSLDVPIAQLKEVHNTVHCTDTCYSIIKINPKVSLDTIGKSSEYKFIFKENDVNGRILSIPYRIYLNISEEYTLNDSKIGLRGSWKEIDYSNYQFTSGEEYVIKLEANVDWKDVKKVEWIPIFYGLELTQWDTWTAGSDLTTATGGFGGAANMSDVVYIQDAAGNPLHYVNIKTGNTVAAKNTAWAMTGDGTPHSFGFNNTDMWGCDNALVKKYNIAADSLTTVFTPSEACQGVTVDKQGISGTVSWFMLLFDNGTMIKYNSAWVQTASYNLTNIAAPSRNSEWYGGLHYNGSDYFVTHKYWVYHLSSTFTNITDGFDAGSHSVTSTITGNNNMTFFAWAYNGAMAQYFSNSEYVGSITSTLNSPANATNTTDTRIMNFTCNQSSTGSITLGSAELFVYNATSQAVWNKYVKIVTGKTNQTSWELTLPTTATSEEYRWNCLVNSSDDSLQDWDVNRTLWIDVAIGVTSYLNTPINNTNYTKFEKVNFTCNSTATETTLDSIIFKIYNQSGSRLYSNKKSIAGTSNQTSWEYTFNYNGTYQWNCQVNSTGNTYSDWDINRTVNLDNIFIDNCTLGTKHTLNFTFIDEDNSSIINGTIESTFVYWLNDKNVNSSYSVKMANSNHTYLYCISPAYANFTSNINARYYSTSGGYSSRYYYADSFNLNNITKTIYLRLLQNESTRKFFVNLRNVDDTVVRGSVINIYKFYEGEGVYKIVASGTTDYYGEFITWLEEDRNHLFAIFINGTNVKNQTLVTKCTETPCTISLKLGPESEAPFGSIDNIPGFYYSLYYDKTTKNASLSYTSDEGTLNNIILTLKKLNTATADIVVCNRTSSLDEDALGCDLSNVTIGQYSAYAYITTAEGKRFVRYISISIDTRFETFGNEGVFWAIGILIVVVFTGLWNPSVAIMLTIAAFGLLAALGIIAVSYTVVIIVVIIGIIYLILMRS